MKDINVPPEEFTTPMDVSVVNRSGVPLMMHTFRTAERVVVVIGRPGMPKDKAERYAEAIIKGKSKDDHVHRG